jgi:hypothetical protein
MERKARVIAFYLPQFHPIPENDKFWGKGFTEWTNVANARPLYKGHYQPHIPADLGFYDLRMPEIREEQAELARKAGIEGFCYWHYWMGEGRMLLERPFMEVLKSGKPDFPFCLGWANGTWSTRTWAKDKSISKDTIVKEQRYSKKDYKDHFFYVLDAFNDHRYIKVDGKPLFYIHDPLGVPDLKYMIELWRSLASENGLNGIYFVGRADNAAFWYIGDDGKRHYQLNPNLDNAQIQYDQILKFGFDAVNSRGQYRAEMKVGSKFITLLDKVSYHLFKKARLKRFNQRDIIRNLYVKEDANENIIPTLLPNWDRSPREGAMAAIYYNSTPEVFGENLDIALELIKNKQPDHKILFLQAWNEWAEGNHVEPDLKYGHGYLDELSKHLL